MMDDRQTIVNTVDGSDWSGAEPIKYYEADGKYYAEMYGLINGMNENLSSLTVTPYARTGAKKVFHMNIRTLMQRHLQLNMTNSH